MEYVTTSSVPGPFASYPKTTSSSVKGSILGCAVNALESTWSAYGSYSFVSSVSGSSEYGFADSRSARRLLFQYMMFVWAVESITPRTQGWSDHGFLFKPNKVFPARLSTK